LKLGAKPQASTWLELYGVSLLCGVGFTMSLFIGALAFPGAIDSPAQVEVKLGVVAGSISCLPRSAPGFWPSLRDGGGQAKGRQTRILTPERRILTLGHGALSLCVTQGAVARLN
jgi:hypothetical protein